MHVKNLFGCFSPNRYVPMTAKDIATRQETSNPELDIEESLPPTTARPSFYRNYQSSSQNNRIYQLID